MGLISRIRTWVKAKTVDVQQTQRTISLSDTDGALPFTLNTDVLGDQELINKDKLINRSNISKNKGE